MWRTADGVGQVGDVAVLGPITAVALRAGAARRNGAAAACGETYKLRLHVAAGARGLPLVMEHGGRLGRTFLLAGRRAAAGDFAAAADLWRSVSAALARGQAAILQGALGAP